MYLVVATAEHGGKASSTAPLSSFGHTPALRRPCLLWPLMLRYVVRTTRRRPAGRRPAAVVPLLLSTFSTAAPALPPRSPLSLLSRFPPSSPSLPIPRPRTGVPPNPTQTLSEAKIVPFVLLSGQGARTGRIHHASYVLPPRLYDRLYAGPTSRRHILTILLVLTCSLHYRCWCTEYSVRSNTNTTDYMLVSYEQMSRALV